MKHFVCTHAQFTAPFNNQSLFILMLSILQESVLKGLWCILKEYVVDKQVVVIDW